MPLSNQDNSCNNAANKIWTLIMTQLLNLQKEENTLFITAFIFTIVIILWPILSHTYLPLADLPNHIARHYIINNPENNILNEYYQTKFLIVPNSAADLLWHLISNLLSPVRFSQLTMAGYAVNFVISVTVLSRVLHGKWSLWSLTASLLVFNGNYFWGFQNFLTSSPFAIWGFILWITTEKTRLSLRLIILIPFIAMLYLMHFFAFAILAIMVFGRELQLLGTAERNLRYQAFLQSLTMFIPFLLPISHLLFEKIYGDLSKQPSLTMTMTSHQQFEALISILAQLPSTVEIKALSLILIVGILLLFTTAITKLPAKLIVNSKVKGALIALTVAACLSPSWLNDVAYVHIRIPFIIIALMFAASQWQGLSTRTGHVLAFIITIAITARAAQIEEITAKHDTEVRDFIETIEHLPEGARLLPVRAAGNEFKDVRLSHLQAYAVIERNAYVPTLFQGVHVLSIREQWRHISHPHWHAIDIRRLHNPKDYAGPFAQPQFWRNWQDDFTHVALFEPVESSLLEGLPIRIVNKKGNFTLFEIIR